MSTKKTKKQCSRVLTCQKVKLQVYTLKYNDASVYVGEIHIESRQRHGKGVFRTSHGDVLDGTWVKGVIAHGLKRFANGDTLQGTAGASTWNSDDGTLTGDGIKTFRNGNVYRGRLERSVQAGFGILESPLRQQTYVGMWVCNQMDGSGRLEFLSSSPLSSPSSSPNVYVGLFVKGQFHGHGRLEYASGAVYEGAFAQNRRHGRGVFRWSPTHDDGDLDFEVYEGMWEADLPHGVGYFTCQHAAFHGQWCRGYPHGAGMYTCRASGDRRRHEFRHGQCIDDPNIVFDRVSVVS
ncbi:hypothetical protein DYB28_006933 [Aphanomyces astaci]|uniref:MORN repeat-containing protein n=1 Tax=Aphanomyces astaci TaxID=112090 RepID=A0A9X8H2L4_APHAT|nr:hypothetical protein DYB28_006933 [Aphanomyces astaci]